MKIRSTDGRIFLGDVKNALIGGPTRNEDGPNEIKTSTN